MMKYISYSERKLKKFSGWFFVWYPYVSFKILGRPHNILLVDCVVSSFINDKNQGLLLSRIIPAGIVSEANTLPLPLDAIEHPGCSQSILEDSYKSEMPREDNKALISYDLTDYLAVRLLGVPSALRKIDHTFRAYAMEALSPLKLLEEFKLDSLEYQGIIFQLLALEKSKGRVQIIEGEKSRRQILLEKILGENKHIQYFLFAKAKPLR